MTRVSSFGHNQSMVSQLLQNQSRLFETQEQVNTGKKSTHFAGYAREAQTLLGAKSLISRTINYEANLKDIDQKLAMNDLYLENAYNAADNLRQAMAEVLANDSVASFGEDLKQAASIILSSMNAQMDGRYMFSGSKTDMKSVNADSLDDLLAAPDIQSLMQGDNISLSARVGDNVEMNYGILASEAGQGLLEVLKAIVDFDQSPGNAFEGKLSAAQRNFLEGQLSDLRDATDKLQSEISANGARQNRVAVLKENNVATQDYLTVFVSDIEDVDLTEAATRFSADQLALEASYTIVSQISKLSLVNYL